jgi:hypothetical protein
MGIFGTNQPVRRSRIFSLHALNSLPFFRHMMKKILPLAALALLTGCEATFTNLTPKSQVRNASNLYQVEVAFNSSRQALRWDSIDAQIMVGPEFYKMRQTLGMDNRWEGLIPVPPGTNQVYYRYKFDFRYNAFGNSKPDSAVSGQYNLHILDQGKP